MSLELDLYAQDQAARSAAFDAETFERTFHHEVASVEGGVRIHYVRGGQGQPLVLLHGFPQHWREWRLVMPALATAGYEVIAPDLRGFGESDKPLTGFDVATVANDLRQVVHHLTGEPVDLVGHDVGASVAYAWAAAHPDEVRRLALMDAFPAGLELPMPQPARPPWHLLFLAIPDLPETLLADRERPFLEFLFRNGAHDQTSFSDAEIDAYVRPFARSGGTRGGIAHIRAIPLSAEYNRELSQRKLGMPVLAIGSASTFGESMAHAARQFAEDVTSLVADRCGHWIPEERPVWLATQLINFFSADSP